jgi:ribosomal 50S subunit-associated protein YjgA (DUF615 family)
MFEQLQYQAASDQQKQEQFEKLGNMLLHNENSALDLLIPHCPSLDIQQLRQLLRQCRKEQEGNEIYALNSSASGKKLLGLLKALNPDKEVLMKADW